MSAGHYYREHVVVDDPQFPTGEECRYRLWLDTEEQVKFAFEQLAPGKYFRYFECTRGFSISFVAARDKHVKKIAREVLRYATPYGKPINILPPEARIKPGTLVGYGTGTLFRKLRAQAVEYRLYKLGGKNGKT